MTTKNLLISEKSALTLAKHLNLPKIHALTGCDTTSYLYRVEKIKAFKKLLGQQYLCFLLSELVNCSQITNNVKSPTTLMKIPKHSLDEPFIMKTRRRVMSIPGINYTKFSNKSLH